MVTVMMMMIDSYGYGYDCASSHVVTLHLCLLLLSIIIHGQANSACGIETSIKAQDSMQRAHKPWRFRDVKSIIFVTLTVCTFLALGALADKCDYYVETSPGVALAIRTLCRRTALCV